MKYEYYPKRRTEQERRELNEQIIRLLQSEACEQAGVTDEDIFNRYTGDGGLHGLRRSDYENYNAFSAAKKELENGQFFTPPPLCEMIVSALRLTDTDLVADLTCGMGNFFNFLPNENTAYGCEVDPNACAVARKLYPQAHIVQGDIRDYEPQTHFDFVLGNPPFHLRWIMPDATVMTSHQYYCLKAAKLLKPLGILAVIVPASFLADSFSDKGAIRMMESRFSFLGQVMLPEHAFSDSGVDGFPTKLQFWQKKSTAADWTPKRYSTDCADIYIPSGHPVMAATALYEKFVMVAKADLAGNRNKVLLELAQLKTTKSTFLYQVKKYLYQIRSHPATREKYDACFSYVHRFYTQRQPGDMPYEEWQRVQLTEAKVLAYLKQALCRQNAKPERDEIRLVKQRYSFVYKAYSRKMAKLLTDEMRAPVPIYQAVLNDEPERFPGYERLLRRKRREYDNQEQPFSEMTENAQHADWIGRFQYWDAQNHAYIHLNPLQSHDVNLTLQKRYAFLQWEQGSGKTPAAIFTGKHRVEMGAVHSIWVISSAISIRNNWDVILKGAGFSYVFVERLSDLQRIRPGDFVILTLNKVSQYKKQIGRYIKQLGYKIQFIFDESDNISNPSSKQTLSVAQVFFRLAQNGRKGFIVQIFLRHIVVGGRFRVFVHIPGLREQVGPVAQAGHIEGIPGQLLLAHKLQGKVGKGFVFQRHIADIPGIGIALAVVPGFPHHTLRQNILAVKKHLQSALHLGKRPFPLVEHREDGDEHIGIVLNGVQVKVVLVIIVGAFVGVQVVLQLRLHICIGGLGPQNILVL